MGLRQYQTDQYEYSPKENTPHYYAYQQQTTHRQQVKDLVFFTNIALFGVLTVCAIYTYLSLQLSSFLALPLGLATGFVGLLLIHFSRHAYYKHKKNRYKC